MEIVFIFNVFGDIRDQGSQKLFYITEYLSLLITDVDGEDRDAYPQYTCILHSVLTLSRVVSAYERSINKS